jgi:hypothetical protein
MPLKLNVGASKKVGEANYGSRGASINVEMELDSSLVNDPPKLQERIRQLFGLVRSSLAEELNGNHGNSAQPSNGPPNLDTTPNGSQSAPQPASQPNPPVRPATQSQVRALHAICKNHRLNLNQLLRDRFKLGRPEDLSIKEASQLIDSLKSTRKEG